VYDPNAQSTVFGNGGRFQFAAQANPTGDRAGRYGISIYLETFGGFVQGFGDGSKSASVVMNICTPRPNRHVCSSQISGTGFPVRFVLARLFRTP
jgi:hypothetical protein